MPQVKYTSAQGLVESAGSGFSLQGNNLMGAKQKTITLTGADATHSLTSEETGAVVLMGGSNTSTVTLPAVSAGLRYTFVASSAQNHLINGGASVIQGSYFHSANKGTVAHVAISNKVSLKLHDTNPAIGDHLEFWCDGTNWYVSGLVNNALTQA
jgi:hypothetical protein